MTIRPQDIDRVIHERFPARGPFFELHAVPLDENTPDRYASLLHQSWRPGDPPLGLTLRLVVWDPLEGGARSIRDIKEQQCAIVLAEHLDQDARVEAYLEGWADALEKAFAVGTEIETYMPCDLTYPDVLSLHIPRRPEQFADAMLVRSRLGKLLPLEGSTDETVAPETVAAWLESHFPVVTPHVEVHFVPDANGEVVKAQPWNASVFANMELVRHLSTGTSRRQASVQLIPPRAVRQGARLENFVAGLAMALEEVLGQVDRDANFGPWQLVHTNVLELASPNRPDEFAMALMAKGRLGKLLGR